MEKTKGGEWGGGVPLKVLIAQTDRFFFFQAQKVFLRDFCSTCLLYMYFCATCLVFMDYLEHKLLFVITDNL